LSKKVYNHYRRLDGNIYFQFFYPGFCHAVSPILELITAVSDRQQQSMFYSNPDGIFQKYVADSPGRPHEQCLTFQGIIQAPGLYPASFGTYGDQRKNISLFP
jgi:hypothetical protein